MPNETYLAGVETGWSEGAPGWLLTAIEVGPWVLAAAVVVLAARALARRHRYRAVDVLDDDAQRAVRAALVAAESKTVGEIVPVVVERSDPHPAGEWIAALAAVLLGTALLVGVLPWEQPAWLVLCQLGLGAAGYLTARALPDLKRLLLSERRCDEVVDEQAFQEFYRLGLHRTERSTGVLLFVSLLEHRVVVLGDEGIDAEVDPELWVEATRAVLDGVASNDLRAGLVRAIELCGEVLAEAFPSPDGGRNEVPDRLVVRRD